MSSIPTPITDTTITVGWGNTVRLAVHDLSTGHEHDGILSKAIPQRVESSYLIYKDGTTINALNSEAGTVEFSGTVFTTVVQNVLDNLTADRTWKEKVVFRGEFEVDYNVAEILIPNYTILDFAGSILKVKDGTTYDTDKGILKNKVTPATNIEIKNLTFDENSSGAPDGWAFLIWFTRASNTIIRNCDLRSPNMEYVVFFGGTPMGTNLLFEYNICRLNYPEFYIEGCRVLKNYFEEEDSVTLYGGFSIFSENIFLGDRFSLSLRSDHIEVSDNLFEFTTTALMGCMYLGTTTYSTNESVIKGNILIGNGGNARALWIGDSTNRGEIIDNIVVNFDEGISVNPEAQENLISKNYITNCNYGIVIEGSTISGKNYLIGNILKENNEGIRLESHSGHDPFGNFVRDNIFNNNTINIVDQGYDNEKKYNIGYLTENSGTSTIDSGESIDTGLVRVPTSVYLSARSASTVNVSWNTVNTSATIVVYHDAGASVPVSWSAEV